MYASFLGISEALHPGIFHQPQKSGFFDSFARCPAGNIVQQHTVKSGLGSNDVD